MKIDFLKKGLGLLLCVYCLTMFFGCNTATSSLSAPASNDEYTTAEDGGPAIVPFSATFRIVSGNQPVNVNTISATLGEPNQTFVEPPTLIYKYNEDPAQMTNPYGLTIEPDPLTVEEDSTTVFTVSGDISLSTPGQYTVLVNCAAYNSSSFYTDFTNTASFQVLSGFNHENYVGGPLEFNLTPNKTGGGTCFWNSIFSEFLYFPMLTGFVGLMMPVDFPGWADLPATIVMIEEDPPFPQVEATLTQGADQIDVDYATGTVDFSLPEDQWMILDLTLNPDPIFGGLLAICGLEFSFDPAVSGALLPTSATTADLEVSFINMAWKISESEDEGETWEECTPRRNTLFEIETQFDALPECSTTLYWSHR